MTKAEFFNHLNELIKSHSLIAKSKKLTFNELTYVLRMDKGYDYNINVKDLTKPNSMMCIPSVKECFIPINTLKQHIKSVSFEENDFGCEEVCITVYLEK